VDGTLVSLIITQAKRGQGFRQTGERASTKGIPAYPHRIDRSND